MREFTTGEFPKIVCFSADGRFVRLSIGGRLEWVPIIEDGSHFGQVNVYGKRYTLGACSLTPITY